MHKFKDHKFVWTFSDADAEPGRIHAAVTCTECILRWIFVRPKKEEWGDLKEKMRHFDKKYKVKGKLY